MEKVHWKLLAILETHCVVSQIYIVRGVFFSFLSLSAHAVWHLHIDRTFEYLLHIIDGERCMPAFGATKQIRLMRSLFFAAFAFFAIEVIIWFHVFA